MDHISKVTIAVALVATVSGAASAQTRRERPVAADRYEALAVDSAPAEYVRSRSGVVPPSESRTVMGLRVPD